MHRLRFLRALALYASDTLSTTTAQIQTSPSDYAAGVGLIRPRWISCNPVLRMPVVSFPLAQTGEGIAECELIKWLVKEGDRVSRFDKVCEVQSDKASIEISSPYEGVVVALPHQPGDVIPVGGTLMEIDADATVHPDLKPNEPTAETPPAPTRQQTQLKNEQTENRQRPAASPAVRLLAKNHGIDLSAVAATGPEGRVTKEDIMTFVESQKQPETASMLKAGVREGRIPLKGFRRAMLKSMTAALSVPHFHFCDDVDVSALLSVRDQLAKEPQLRNHKFTLLPILIKALSVALLEFPEINSSLNANQSELILHPHHHIGVAIAVDEGLVVPHVKHVQEKTIIEISRELHRLKGDALLNTLNPEDLTNATITISNVGSVGGLYATPLVVPPQSAIVALGKARTVVDVPDGSLGTLRDTRSLRARPMMPISWGADHRVLDGATLVEFSNRWKQLIEEPARMNLFLR